MLCFIQPLIISTSSKCHKPVVCVKPRSTFLAKSLPCPVKHFKVRDEEHHETGNYQHVTTPSMKDNTSMTSRVIAGAMIAGLVISALLPFAGVIKNAFSDNGESLVIDKLSHVPAFTVTDSSGRPYLSETEDGRFRRGYFFVQPADAEKYLEQVRSNTDDAKVLAIGMDEALKFLESGGTPARSVPERFELFPDDHEFEIAQKYSNGQFRKTFGQTGIPVFYIDGLAFRDDKTGGTVIPLFFEKERLDEAFSRLKKSDPQSSISEDDLQIVDFLQTVKELRAGSDVRFTRVMYIPLSDSLKTLQKMKN